MSKVKYEVRGNRIIQDFPEGSIFVKILKDGLFFRLGRMEYHPTKDRVYYILQ